MLRSDVPYYPLFLNMRDEPALVAGAGKVGLRKVQGLLEAGARVTVVAPQAVPGFQHLPVRLLRRRFRAKDVEGMTLVFAATNDRRVNRRIGAVARSRGIFANIADSPEECRFLVPSRIQRGPVQIAVSTGGTDPRLAREIRRKIQNFLG